ncbi:TIGR02281 family clan AA aspartic protease [Sphingomonas sp. MMS24-J45]|uniref:retropepsin-like aspartic protease family protein n=1 Tax=Sphingomonas sp. MMS24-J45 TaxID=3238806 RepID=UPI00384B88FA
MKLALGSVIIVGIGIGLALPAAKRPVAPVAAAAPAYAEVSRDVPKPTHIERSNSGHFLTVAEVNKEPIRFLVDTGADTVALTMEDARRAHVDFDPSQFQIVGKGAAGYVRGQEVRIADIVLDGKRVSDVRGVVLEDSEMSLLGQTYLRHIDTVKISADTMTLE